MWRANLLAVTHVFMVHGIVRMPLFRTDGQMTVMSTTMTTDDKCTSTASTGICKGWSEVTFNWNLCDSQGNRKGQPSRNNLGGLGPNPSDPQEIRYDNVALLNGKSLDLVVTNKSVYTPYDITRNNVKDDTNDVAVHGCFGVVNVAHDTQVQLNFAFKEHGLEEVAEIGSSDWFMFSVWDMDKGEGSEESFQWEINDQIPSQSGSLVGEKKSGDTVDGLDYWKVQATALGNGADNPVKVNGVPDVNNKSVEVLVKKGTATWDVNFGVAGGKRGRNFLFQGCRPCSTTTTTTGIYDQQLMGIGPTPGVVTCYVTADNVIEVLGYMVNDTDVRLENNAQPPGKLDDWETAKTFSFYEVEGGVLAIKAKNKESDEGENSCKNAGLVVSCTSTNTASIWHHWISSQSSMRSIGRKLDNRGPNGWIKSSFDDNSWEQPCISTSGFDMTVPSPYTQPTKIWGRGKFSFFRSTPRSVVTCYITADDKINQIGYMIDDTYRVYIPKKDGRIRLEDKLEPPGKLDHWETAKKFSFDEVVGGVLAIRAKNEQSDEGEASCQNAGLLVSCRSTWPDSMWHNWVSSPTTMRSIGATSKTLEEDDALWMRKSFDDSNWEQPCISTSGFKMTVPSPYKEATKIWGRGKFSWFRSTKQK